MAATSAEASGSETLGSERYLRICKRLSTVPEPLLLRVLRGPYNNGCSYSTLEAEASLDAIAVRGIIAALDYARGLHTIRLVGLRRGNESMLTRDCLVTLVRALRSSPSVETLDLSDNSLRDSVAAQHLGALISRHSTIVCLLLANNCLGEVSGKMLLIALEGNKMLRHLDISSNPGLVQWPSIERDLERMVKTNQTLVGLGASFCTTAAASLLCAIVQAPSRMRTLELTHSALTVAAVEQAALILASRQER